LDKEEIKGLEFQEKGKHLMSICTENNHNQIINDCNVFANLVQFEVGRQRLGYRPHNKMRFVPPIGQSQLNEKEFICDICPKAK